ncbi:MAG: hypothetical protein ABSG46_02085 [Candidatus Binataceae bacterium]|jgi:hypothetical protein
MSLTEWFWPNSRARAIDSLASIASRYALLADSLKRHAAMCNYPTLRSGLEQLALFEAEQAQTLQSFLQREGRAAQAAAPSPPGASANNWQRLNADLTLHGELLRELNQVIVLLEGREHHAEAWLRDFAAREERSLGDLRDLTLKCDPQALD